MSTELSYSRSGSEYKYGFTTDVETDSLPKGLNEEVIRAISAKKEEPAYMLEFRLKAYRRWLEMSEPHWSNVDYPPIDYRTSLTIQPQKRNPP